jgi:DNA-binding response OmpR family regulator
MGAWADVLIVEDEKKLRFFASEVFKFENINAEAVEDGCKAAEYFNAVQSQGGKMPRVVLLDLSMPCMSGQDVYKGIAASDWGSNTTVIITSAAGEKVDPLPGVGQTISLHKPYEVKDLLDLLRNIAPDLFSAGAAQD